MNALQESKGLFRETEQTKELVIDMGSLSQELVIGKTLVMLTGVGMDPASLPYVSGSLSGKYFLMSI